MLFVYHKPKTNTDLSHLMPEDMILNDKAEKTTKYPVIKTTDNSKFTWNVDTMKNNNNNNVNKDKNENKEDYENTTGDSERKKKWRSGPKFAVTMNPETDFEHFSVIILNTYITTISTSFINPMGQTRPASPSWSGSSKTQT